MIRARWLTIAALAAAVATMTVLSSCDKGKDAGPGKHGTTVVISGDTAGWIVPCGCTTHQSGGLPRRGTYVNSLRKQAELVILDAGGAPGGNSPYQRLKFEAILRGEKRMGLAVHNVGGPEAAIGADGLREAARKTGARMISANLRDSSGQPVFEDAAIVETAGRKLAVIGVLSPTYATGGTRIDEPKPAVLASLRKLEGQHDSVIVLAYMPEDELQRLAAELPEVDAVVGGPTGQAVPPRGIGPTTLAAATNKGKFLVELQFTAGKSGGPPTGRIVELTGDYTDDAGQLANVKTYLAELDRLDFTADQTGLVPPLPADTPAEYRIAGNATCVDCHQRDDQLWKASRHAKAWEDLKQMGRQVDPYCQQCHTTGYGLPGGFISVGKSLNLVGVGCENCHGPSQSHVENPDIKTSFDAKDQCVRCHDRENSPKFGYDHYWEKIKHGETPGTQPARPTTSATAKDTNS